MQIIAEAFTEIVRLIGDTFRLWWKNLLALLTWFLAGYLVFRAASLGAVWLRVHQHDTLGIGLFSFGVLAQVVAVVGMIRTIASSLYRWRDAAAGPGETTDPTQQRLLELLAVTMLPLIAVWSAWGLLEDRLDNYASDYLITKGVGEPLFRLNGGQWKVYLPAIGVLLVLRRVVEWIDDRRPSRAVKFIQVWIEAFFLLLLVVITPSAISTAKNWIEGREFWYFITNLWETVKEWFAGIRIPIPDGIEFLWGVFSDTLWPLFKDGVANPLTWLAITTVVFGHRALSAGGVVRGTRFESALADREVPASQSRVAALTSRAPNLVLGGLKEKFLPTLNAFRLLVRVGPVFLGVVCLVYSMYDVAYNWFYVGITHRIGDHGSVWSIMWGNIVGLAGDALFEPLRIALLAAAFDQAVSVGVQRRSEAPQRTRAPVPEDSPAMA